MNLSNWKHMAVAIFVQLICWPFIGPLGGAFAGVWLFIGRETTQAIEKRGSLWNWNTDSVLDIVFPIAGTGLVWWVFG